jgi:hypothetical protein
MRQHRLPGAPVVVESRPFGVPHEATELIAIPGRSHRYPMDRDPARGFQQLSEALFFGLPVSA